jgi:hypothetical protein
MKWIRVSSRPLLHHTRRRMSHFGPEANKRELLRMSAIRDNRTSLASASTAGVDPEPSSPYLPLEHPGAKQTWGDAL